MPEGSVRCALALEFGKSQLCADVRWEWPATGRLFEHDAVVEADG